MGRLFIEKNDVDEERGPAGARYQFGSRRLGRIRENRPRTPAFASLGKRERHCDGASRPGPLSSERI
jgi:hypothetical protein